MLTPEQINALRDKAGELTDPVIEFLITDIADRISEVGQLTSSAAYEVWKAQKLGLSQNQLKKELQKRLKVTSQQLEQMFTQAAKTGYDFDQKRIPHANAVPFDENVSLQQILDAAIKQAQEDFTNITQTMGFVGPDGRFLELTEAYQRACDFAFEKVATGAQDYNSAVRDATRGLAEKGIRVLDYASGTNRSIEAAVRQNTMDGLGIMAEQITKQNHDLLGCDGWEISAHGGSAPDHEPIQGKQYSDEEYTRLNNSLVRRIGTLNCGHSAMPIILGVNEPQYTKAELEELRRQNEEGVTYEGRHYTLYEAAQRQRKLETAIRNRKRRILIDEHLGDKDALQNDQIRLQLLKQEHNRFSKAVDLPMQHERMEAAGFDWKKGKAAEKTAKVYQDIAKMAQSDKSNNDWTEAVPRIVTREEKASLIAYAEERGINIPGLRKFDGDPQLLKSEIDALHSIQRELSVGKRITLTVSQSLDDEDFAETSGEHITLNAKALRNRSITERNLSEGNLFAGTAAEDIVVHEYGHVFSSFKGNKGIEIARKARYNVFGEESSLDEILAFLDENISDYSTVFSARDAQANQFNLKKYKEIIPEVIVKHSRGATDFTSEFVRLLKELV